MFSVPLCIHLEMELLGHIITLHLTFPGTVKLYSKEAVPFYIPTSNVWELYFLYILANTCYCLFDYTILVGIKWYFTVALICFALMTKDVEHLHMCLWTIWMSPLENIKILNHLKLGCWDLSGGAVVKTPRSQCRGPGFDPWSGTRPHTHATTKEPLSHN